MNKALTIGFVLLMVVVLGLATYFVMKRQSHVENEGVPTMEETGSTDTSMQTKSLRDLLTLGSNQTCTFTDSETNSQGTVFMSNNKVRGDFTSEMNTAIVNSHMIIDGDTLYVWQDGMEDGFKMSVASYEDMASNPNQPDFDASSAVDIDKQINYSCQTWSADESLFTAPADREFIDLSTSMNAGDETTGMPNENASDNCGMCETVPEEARAQCLKALSCN